MASARPINQVDESSEQAILHQRLGLLNGALIGLALAVGLWGQQVWALSRLPIELPYASVLLGSGALMLLYSVTGWLTARLRQAAVTVLLWLGAAVLSTFIIGYQPSFGRTLAVWLLDRRFWGLPVYPLAVESNWIALGMVLAGFFIILLLSVLSLFQEYRLENVQRELRDNRRLSVSSWRTLLMPLPLVVLAGLITNSIIGTAAWRAVPLVEQAIQVNLTHEGDLFQLGLQEGSNYAALQGVREQLTDQYTLAIAEINPAAVTTIVVAHFDNGAWVNCRVVNDQLSFCYDAAPPYRVGFASLLTGTAVPADCIGCLPVVNDQWQNWLAARRDRLGGEPRISREAQWGSHVLMRATSANGDYLVDCLFEGTGPVRLLHCSEPAGM
jgi:hypothetical protein